MAKASPPVVVISGGSSGIGLALALALARTGAQLVLLARDEQRLANARDVILRQTGVSVLCEALDVQDELACQAVIGRVLAQLKRIDWLITSAGIAEPGNFIDLPLESHQRQMNTNYFGTLHLVRTVVPGMLVQGAGRITLVASAAAFVGIVGYSGYSPGKFAVRALGETLLAELGPQGISVTVAFPPDTDTPQYAAEAAAKPEATRAISAGGGFLDADTVARSIIRDSLAGRFRSMPTFKLHLFALFHSLYTPFFLAYQQRVVRRFSRSR